MVWPAVLLVLLLVLGEGEASGFICDEFTAGRIAAGNFPEDRLMRSGFFVDPARQTRLFLRVRLNDKIIRSHQCFLQHEDGPLSLAGGYWTGFVGRCHDPVSGRDHVILSASSGGTSGYAWLEYWSVHPDTEQMTLEYRQSVYGESEFKPRPELSDADDQCLWRQQKRAHDVFDGAMAALGVGVELEAEALALAVGDTHTLPTRPLSAAVVRHWLHALHTHAPGLVTFETARSSDASPPPPWRILQILGGQPCNDPGVVLLQDTRSGQWRSLYDVRSGCTENEQFSLREMVITGETLFAEFCTECEWRGRYGKFRLDLPTNRVTRLEGEGSWGANMPVTDPLAFVDQGGSDPSSAADATR